MLVVEMSEVLRSEAATLHLSAKGTAESYMLFSNGVEFPQDKC